MRVRLFDLKALSALIYDSMFPKLWISLRNDMFGKSI